MTMWATPWRSGEVDERARLDPRQGMRTTSAPSSLAMPMFASRWRCVSESIRVGASSGVCT